MVSFFHYLNLPVISSHHSLSPFKRMAKRSLPKKVKNAAIALPTNKRIRSKANSPSLNCELRSVQKQGLLKGLLNEVTPGHFHAGKPGGFDYFRLFLA